MFNEGAEINKCLANAKRPCNCRVLCLCLKSSTLQLCALYFRHDVIRLSWPRSWQCVPSALNANVKKFKKVRVNYGSNYDSQGFPKSPVNGGSNCGLLKDTPKSLFEPRFLDLGLG